MVDQSHKIYIQNAKTDKAHGTTKRRQRFEPVEPSMKQRITYSNAGRRATDALDDGVEFPISIVD
jgi:hypothetical protein